MTKGTVTVPADKVTDVWFSSYTLVFSVGERTITLRVQHRSLLDTQVNAMVNAANEGMRGGGGIDGAIHNAAGPKLLEALKKEAPNGCQTGEIVVTPGFNTGADYIFHTPGPVWHGGNQQERQYLDNCYWNCINEANTLRLQSIGFCSISTGVYGYPLKEASQVAVGTIMRYIECSLEEVGEFFVDEIIFAMRGEAEYEMFVKAMEQIAEPWANLMTKYGKPKTEDLPTLWETIKAWFRSWVE